MKRMISKSVLNLFLYGTFIALFSVLGWELFRNYENWEVFPSYKGSDALMLVLGLVLLCSPFIVFIFGVYLPHKSMPPIKVFNGFKVHDLKGKFIYSYQDIINSLEGKLLSSIENFSLSLENMDEFCKEDIDILNERVATLFIIDTSEGIEIYEVLKIEPGVFNLRSFGKNNNKMKWFGDSGHKILTGSLKDSTC